MTSGKMSLHHPPCIKNKRSTTQGSRETVLLNNNRGPATQRKTRTQKQGKRKEKGGVDNGNDGISPPPSEASIRQKTGSLYKNLPKESRRGVVCSGPWPEDVEKKDITETDTRVYRKGSWHG